MYFPYGLLFLMYTAAHYYLGPQKEPTRKGPFGGGPFWEALLGDLGSYALQCILFYRISKTERNKISIFWGIVLLFL